LLVANKKTNNIDRQTSNRQTDRQRNTQNMHKI